MGTRSEVVGELAASIPAAVDHPVRVAIDGMTGVGKTTLRGELADALRALGRPVTEVSADDFHHQRERRYAQGRGSAIGYFEDAYDYEALAQKLLIPLGPGGDRQVRLRHHDLETDALLSDEPTVRVAVNAVVVVDGSFLQRPESAAHWDWVIFVEATREASAERQVVRDGAPADPEHPYHARYFGGYDIYQERLDPRSSANVVLDNTDLGHPRIVRT